MIELRESSWRNATLAICPHVYPLTPTCATAVDFATSTLIAITVLLSTLAAGVPRSYHYRRMGALPCSFFLVVCALALLVAKSLAYTIYVFYLSHYSHLLLAFCVSRVFLWLVVLVAFVRARDFGHLPFSLALAFSVAALLQLLPLNSWSDFFPPRTFHNGEFAFYAFESLLVATVFLSSMVVSTLRTDSTSTWSGLSRKIAMIAPFVWPKGSMSLQLRVAMCLLLLLAGRLINVALPLYNKWIVDALAHPNNFDYSLIIISSALKFLQGNGAMGGFLNTVRSYLWIPIQQYTTRELEVELFSHLHNLSLKWHLSRKTGQVLRIMDRGTNSVNQILNYLLFNVLPTIADIAIAVAFFFTTFNWYFGGIVLLTMIIYLAITIFVTEWRTKFRREMNELENASSAIATDSLLNAETVKYYGNETYEVNRFRNAVKLFQAAEWRANASLSLLNFLQNGTIGFGLTGGSLLVAYFICQGNTPLTVGDYVLFTTYMLQLYAPLNFFGTVYRMIQKSFIDMENMFDLLHEEVEIRDAVGAREFHPHDGRLEVRDLSFGYHEGRDVLHNISFSVGSGETVALVGPSGSGKSTLVRLIFRLFDVGNGVILFDGHDAKTLTMKSLRQSIGIVPQDTVLFNDTIRYNIRFGNPSATDEEVEEAAKAAMIHDKILSLPDGYDTVVGERGLKLSGGEKQRVAIARTILKKPQFIMLDEATSALDTHTERAIQKCLELLCKTRTSIVVAHRLSTVVHASQILVIDKGRIVESGTHGELLEIGGVYAALWQAQQAEMGTNGSPGGSSKGDSGTDTLLERNNGERAAEDEVVLPLNHPHI